jgi:hypothetical protein
MTKQELLESQAFQDAPMDADLYILTENEGTYAKVIKYDGDLIISD